MSRWLVLSATLVAAVGCQERRLGTDRGRSAVGEPFAEPPVAADLDPDGGVVRVQLSAGRLSGNPAAIFGYNGSSPGPTIRAEVGDTLIVEFTNDLDVATTVHWHGVSVPFEMDGVTWMRDPIAPGATFTYQFALTTAGTFWYHPHFNTEAQVEGGLFGALIVSDPSEPAPDRELVMVVDAAEELQPQPSPSGHEKRNRTWRVNGVEQPDLRLPGGENVRVRFINVANAAYLALDGTHLEQIGSDQGLLPTRRVASMLLLGPGDRIDVEVRVGEDDFAVQLFDYSLNGGRSWGEPTTLFDVTVEDPAPRPAALNWPFPGGISSPDPGYADIVYALSGSDRTHAAMINGEQFPNVTIESLALGSVGFVEVRNLSPTEHPFHLHGMPFEVVSIDGLPPAERTVEDTINVRIRQTLRLKVEANNPGDWMTHCHILPHAEQGMMTVLRVE